MISSREKLVDALKGYRTPYPTERNFINDFLGLLEHPDAYQRYHLPGHLTGSAWIISEDGNSILLTHHAKLNRWLQPGGHADGDENIYQVALREAEEETGLNQLILASENFFDIDIHRIPARKDFPEHFHYDVRFLFRAKATENLIISDESHDLAWKSLDEIPSLTDNSESILRMVEKTKLLRGDQ